MNNIFNYIIFVVLLYFIFSITEHLVHRYIMHSPKNKFNIMSSDHWTHHEHTLNDMNLTNSIEYNSLQNKYLGLYFIWSYSFIVFLVGLTEGFLLYLILNVINIKIKPIYVVLWVIIFSIYQTSFGIQFIQIFIILTKILQFMKVYHDGMDEKYYFHLYILVII